MKAQTRGAAAGTMDVVARELTSEMWPAVQELFGANGACGGCWCQAWRIEKGERWAEVKGDAAKERMRRGIQDGTIHGALAFVGKEPVGWCTFGPRNSFPRLNRARSLQCDDPASVWSVPCFYVRRDLRGRGVATALLAEALRAMTRRGVEVVEAYPSAPNKDGSYIAAFSWTGTLPLFQNAGFAVVGNPEGSKRRMRRNLSGAP